MAHDNLGEKQPERSPCEAWLTRNCLYRFEFINPIDLMPMRFDDEEEAAVIAESFLGRSAFGETIDEIAIYEVREIRRVR